MPKKYIITVVMVVLMSLFANSAVASTIKSQEVSMTHSVSTMATSESPVRAYTSSMSMVKAAVSTGSKSKIKTLIKQAATTKDVELAAALLASAESRDEIKLNDSKQVKLPSLTAFTSTKAGCYPYSFSDRHTIAIAGVNLAWQEVLVGGFCWNGTAITRNGGVWSQRWSAAPYCWKDVGTGQYWTYYPKWIKAYTVGTVGGNAIWGCISLQRNEASMEYANGGGKFRH